MRDSLGNFGSWRNRRVAAWNGGIGNDKQF